MKNSTLDIHHTLDTSFGFSEFLPGQEQVIRTLLAGRNAIAIFPTGSGKSLCYQLSALHLDGLTLVISPLIALMKDQIDSLQRRGIAAERLDSSLDEERYREVTSAIRQGELKLLFISPERMTNERFRSLLSSQCISLLAIDEAHCISSWGHNFRPDYLKLAPAAQELGAERILALTATATAQVSADMASAFHVEAEDVVNTGFHRPNLDYRVTACRAADRPALLVQRLQERPAGPTIVYVSLQRHAEETAEHLCHAGFNARAYHAGMSSDDRHAVQDGFMGGQVDIICATIAFGMGVDKSDIRYIYHYHLAKGFESYLQETGRAGRDGLAATCELFACADDCTTLENFVYGDTPDEHSIRGLLEELLGEGDEIDISIHHLSRNHDIRKLVVSTILTRLELQGILRAEGYYYSAVKFSPRRPSAEILSTYSPSQVAFLQTLFRCCSKAKKWVTLDIDQAVGQTGHGRDVILRALSTLEFDGHLELQLAGYRQRLRRTCDEINLNDLCQTLLSTCHAHEQMEINRIASMLEYAEHEGCFTEKLLAYFGEPIDHCGHCGHCLGDAPVTVFPRQSGQIEDCNLGEFVPLVQAHPEALSRPRQQARFLCGLNSPAVSATRELRGNPLFGRARTVPFAEVLRYCESQ